MSDILTYQECQKLMDTPTAKGKGYRKLANNTYLYDRGTHFAVKLHDTDIILIKPNGNYELNSGGWETVTTKERINRFSPARINTDHGIWYLYKSTYDEPIATLFAKHGYSYSSMLKLRKRGGTWHLFNNDEGIDLTFPSKLEAHNFRCQRIIYYDGIEIDSFGEVVSDEHKGNAFAIVIEEVKTMVREYIDGYVKHVYNQGHLSAPSGGDCWGCYFPLGMDGMKRGEEPMGYGHLFSHFKSNYFVPSLLFRAIKERTADQRGVQIMAGIIDRYAKANDMRSLRQYISMHLVPYFKSRRHEMVTYVMAVAPPSSKKPRTSAYVLSKVAD